MYIIYKKVWHDEKSQAVLVRIPNLPPTCVNWANDLKSLSLHFLTLKVKVIMPNSLGR